MPRVIRGSILWTPSSKTNCYVMYGYVAFDTGSYFYCLLFYLQVEKSIFMNRWPKFDYGIALAFKFGTNKNMANIQHGKPLPAVIVCYIVISHNMESRNEVNPST